MTKQCILLKCMAIEVYWDPTEDSSFGIERPDVE